MPAFRSPIDLGIPEVPAGVPDDWVPIFQGIYNALRLLQSTLGDVTGFSFTDVSYFDSLTPAYSDSIQSQNQKMIYLPAKGAISKGTLVGFVVDTGVLKMSEALAAAGATQVRAWGWALENLADGVKGAFCLLDGYNPNFLGLTIGTIYYLSDTTPGGISSAKPVGAGKIVQEVGIALSATELLTRLNTPITL